MMMQKLKKVSFHFSFLPCYNVADRSNLDLAFSSTYLFARGGKGVTINGIKFQILRVAPETQHVLEIENGGLGICPVANGRVEIKLGSESFSVGENGMLRVRG